MGTGRTFNITDCIRYGDLLSRVFGVGNTASNPEVGTKDV